MISANIYMVCNYCKFNFINLLCTWRRLTEKYSCRVTVYIYEKSKMRSITNWFCFSKNLSASQQTRSADYRKKVNYHSEKVNYEKNGMMRWSTERKHFKKHREWSDQLIAGTRPLVRQSRAMSEDFMTTRK